MILPDTPVWVDWLRGAGGDLEGRLRSGQVVTCGPVVAELLAGTAVDAQDALWGSMLGLPWSDLTALAWRDVGALASTLTRSGRHVPLTDVAIAVCAIRADAELLTRDGDFTRIAEVEPRLRLARA